MGVDIVGCTECSPGGLDGWIDADSGPVPPNADGSPRHPPQTTVRPCSTCRPAEYRRWLRGHLPCPKKDSKGLPCSDCKRAHGIAAPTEEEHLPGDVADPRYEKPEPEPEQMEFAPGTVQS